MNDRTVREPDAVVHFGPYDGDKVFAPNPVVVVEVISPPSVRTDVDRKLIDYFSMESIRYYLVVYGEEGRVVHHRRSSSSGEITTAILGRVSVIDLSPPGFRVSVEDLLEA